MGSMYNTSETLTQNSHIVWRESSAGSFDRVKIIFTFIG